MPDTSEVPDGSDLVRNFNEMDVLVYDAPSVENSALGANAGREGFDTYGMPGPESRITFSSEHGRGWPASMNLNETILPRSSESIIGDIQRSYYPGSFQYAIF